MANQLKMAMVNAIGMLKERGWSQRRIDRETVAKYVHLHNTESKPASNAPTGSELSNPATNAPIGSVDPDTARPGPESQCEPYRTIVEDKLEDGLSGQRIYQDLRDEYGYYGSYYSVRRFIKRLREDKPIPFRRMECLAGQESQIDFGTGAPIVRPDSKRRRTHVLRIVLSFSRKGYSEAIFHQDTDSFLRCLENAFWHFGGVPRILTIDYVAGHIRYSVLSGVLTRLGSRLRGRCSAEHS